MIVAERDSKTESRAFDNFGDAMPDGRLTEPSNGLTYHLRDAIMEMRRLGRMLTDEELAAFTIV